MYWIVDYRLFDPDCDGKTKLDHVREMMISAVADKALLFRVVLFDSWYAAKNVMILVDSLKKIYYCPLNGNRLVDDSGGQRPYVRADGLLWGEDEIDYGKTVKIKGFPKNHKVKLFRVEVSKNRTDWVATNDPAQNSVQGVQEACALRWKV